jgi:threonine synthase
MSLLSHLECARCGKRHEAGQVWNVCACGGPLGAKYRLNREEGERLKACLRHAPASLWRYRAVLPVRGDKNIVSLGEGFVPLLRATRLGERLGMPNLFLKDESRNPTGSFKARGLAVAVSMARELGLCRLAMASAGNAGGALAAYAARAGMEATVFMPQATPEVNRLECLLAGARVVTVEGSLADCGRALDEYLETHNAFNCSTLREPYRLEGKKTMAYELYEQLGGRLPDVIVYPAGGGTGLIGMARAFDEMQELGWIGRRRPRLCAVQASGCAPLVRAFAKGAERFEEWREPKTIAAGLLVPRALGDFLMLRALRETRGMALAVEDPAMLAGARELAETEGLLVSPEAGATLAALRLLLREGFLAGYETTVLFLTAGAHKYTEAMRTFERKGQP